MPIVIWIVAVVGALGFIAAICWLVWALKNAGGGRTEYSKSAHVGAAIVTMIVCIALAVGPLYWLYGTASGQRELKSFGSEVNGGLTRTVTVYDLQGDVIKTYNGKFDIQTDNTRVFFDLPQPDGTTKRVQIYNATVIAEEK